MAMTPERWLRVTELFEAALERSPDERAAFLERGCDDEQIRREVESLLEADEADSRFMNTPAGRLLAGGTPALSPGQRFGHYDEISPLAEGGMGQVYLATDARLGRKVALKLLPSAYTGDAERVRRFGQEARAASALNHPNIVTIHEIGETDSLHFIATEYVDGVTLRERMAGGPMTVGEVLDVGAQIASALQAAHDAGIVHRDVKPENVMLRHDAIVKVLDFGLAKLAPHLADATRPDATSMTTNPGVVMGTAAYMSPEQARGEEVDARSDVWSLGVVLYEMTAGHAPFGGETPNHVIVSILDAAPQLLDAEVPANLERIISRALRKDRSERYQSAGEMADDLKSLKEELTVEARLKQFAGPAAETAGPTSSAEYLVDRIRRHKGRAVAASAAVLLLLSVLYYLPKIGGGEPIDSVAVLPFVNVGGDSEAEYLSDGIADGVIASLSRLPDLKVMSLGTVMRYKGKQVDPQAVGRELGVRAVLTGRLSRREEGLALGVELVDVRDGRRMWGAQYDGRTADLVALQDEIAGELARVLGPGPTRSDERRLARHHTDNGEAYDAYLRGRFMLEKRTGDATQKSVEYLEQATRLDPDYALAYAFLSYAYWSLGTLDERRPQEEVLPRARAAVEKALAIDDTVAEAHTALGHVRQSEGDLAGAETAFKRGIELDPISGFVHSNYSHYLRGVGRVDEAVEESRRAVELEPISVLYNRNLGMNLYFARRYDEAIEQCRKTLELDPNMRTAYRWLAKSYEQKQLYDQAVEAYLETAEFGPDVAPEFREIYAKSGWKEFWRKALELKKDRARQKRIPIRPLAENYARLGDIDRALAVIEEANRSMDYDPFWDGLHISHQSRSR
jgi:TolB-like protein/tetratricopeptide (TPR) repeat protein